MKFKYSFLLLLVSWSLHAQDLVDPYKDYLGFPAPLVDIDNFGTPEVVYQSYDSRNILGGYNGEYMISLFRFLWFTKWFNNGVPLNGGIPVGGNLGDMGKSYKIELVSFPQTRPRL